MKLTIDYILNSWHEVFGQKLNHLYPLKPPEKRLVATYVVKAFELRIHVGRCRAWRHKNADEINETFLKNVIVPLAKMNPRITGGSVLIPWSNDYQDQRGPKPSAPKDLKRNVLGALLQREKELFAHLLFMKKNNIDDPVEVKDTEDLLIACNLLKLDLLKSIKIQNGIKSIPLGAVDRAMEYLTAIGIPCQKMNIEVFWINLLATTWGVEPNSIYAIARKVKKIREQE